MKTRSHMYFLGVAMAALCAGGVVLSTHQAAGQAVDAETRAAAPIAPAAPRAGGRGAPAAPVPETYQMAPITANVTNSDAERRNANADLDNWRLHGRTYDNQRFSPLTQINKANVKQLRPVALIQTGIVNAMQATNLVIDGILYVENANDVVQAYDAVTGEELWAYTPVLEASDVCCGPASRGVAVADGKVFVAQLDGHVVALDAKTGKLVWKSDSTELLPEPRKFYSMTNAPQVYNGMVMVGNAGAEWPSRGFFAALDENTGKLVWRFWNTAEPGDPNFPGAWDGESWKIGGGSVWDAAAIDTKNDLAIFAVGNPNPDLYGENRKGSNLYTESMVAVHTATGKLAWYYQQVPHDVWDLDSAAPVVLFDAKDAQGKTVPAAGETNKNGFLYVVDRRTGALIRKSDSFVMRKADTYLVPPSDTAAVYYPGNHGGPMWQPPAFSPITHYFYQMSLNQASIYKVKPMTPYVPGSPDPGIQYGNLPATPAERAALASQMIPDSGDLSAIDVNTGKVAWQYHSDRLMFGGVLATASNLVFAGEANGNFLAFDAKTGKKLWSYNLGVGVCTPPITYRVKGVQYIAVGATGCHYLENLNKAQGRPQFGSAIAIFALPKGR